MKLVQLYVYHLRFTPSLFCSDLNIDLPTGRKLTMDQFLNRLPKVVVKAGRVIDIRDSVKASLQVRLRSVTCFYIYL